MAPATVLVVDDDPVILKLLEVNFEMEGFSVVRAADGAEGLERAREVLPDIVVLDVMMPRMTGYEVAKALREDESTAKIPIIFVTARAQSSDVERGMELGVDDYVTKPFDPLDLIARVNILLARRVATLESDGAAQLAGHPEGAGAPEGNGSAPLLAGGEDPVGGAPATPPGETPVIPAGETPVIPAGETPAGAGDTDPGDRPQL
jgi:CheY-like chemotaxis protein